MTSTIVVPATTGDLQTIRTLTHTIWPEAYAAILSQAQLDYMLDKFYTIDALMQSMAQNQQYVLAVQEGSAIGFMGFEHHYLQKAQTKIHRLYVLPQTQGSGIGKMLLDYAQTQAAASDSKCLTLNVNRFNKAIHFYQKMGFKTVAQEDIDIGNGYLMEDFVMEKPL